MRNEKTEYPKKMQLLTALDIAARLRISKSMAYNLLRLGEIPAVRIGRAVRAREEDVVRYIDEHLDNQVIDP